MLRKFGALPFIAIVLLAGAFMVGQHSAKRGTPPPGKAAEGPVKPGFLGSLFPSASGNGTRVKRFSASDPYDPDATSGQCGYCETMLMISGNKGSDKIRCPNCGGTMTALKAILYFNRSFQGMRR
jgi:LSD1 subclass zinc finger protein